MSEKEQLLENHKRRIKRAGPILWDYMQRISLITNLEKISGDRALEICNTYGLRMIDLMLFFEILSINYDFDEWYRLNFEQEERIKRSVQCNAKRE